MSDLGRTTKAYVSGYARDRVHSSRLYATEKRSLVADFSGAVPAGSTIASIVWNMDCPYSVAMSAAAIDGLQARCLIQAIWPGWQPMRCLATLASGEVYSQLFMVQVQPAPYFGDSGMTAGPTQISA